MKPLIVEGMNEDRAIIDINNIDVVMEHKGAPFCTIMMKDNTQVCWKGTLEELYNKLV